LPLLAEIYDPATGNWAPTAGMKTVRAFPPLATRLQNGSVLVTGGDVAATELFSDPLICAGISDPGKLASALSTVIGCGLR
jgi:hypothetical protein